MCVRRDRLFRNVVRPSFRFFTSIAAQHCWQFYSNALARCVCAVRLWMYALDHCKNDHCSLCRVVSLSMDVVVEKCERKRKETGNTKSAYSYIYLHFFFVRSFLSRACARASSCVVNEFYGNRRSINHMPRCPFKKVCVFFFLSSLLSFISFTLSDRIECAPRTCLNLYILLL